jgi:F0F1-type ATP synthase epsilon subunit
VVEVRPDKVTVLADDADTISEIDMDEIEAARARARDLMAEAPAGEQRAQIAQELRRAEIAAKAYSRAQSRPGQRIRTVDDDSEL